MRQPCSAVGERQEAAEQEYRRTRNVMLSSNCGVWSHPDERGESHQCTIGQGHTLPHACDDGYEFSAGQEAP